MISEKFGNLRGRLLRHHRFVSLFPFDPPLQNHVPQALRPGPRRLLGLFGTNNFEQVRIRVSLEHSQHQGLRPHQI
jgi:hypothetical protein